jgi:hypothetical protein
MRIRLKTIFILLTIFNWSACRKEGPIINPNEKLTEDSLIYRDVKGMVYNVCTDSGIAGIKVYLNVMFKNKLFKKYETLSGRNGEYMFPEAELHSDRNFEYSIYIPSKSGDLAKDFETCGIRGTNMIFNLAESDIFMKPRVVPKFIFLAMYFIGQHIDPADSVVARFEQPVYHRNVPDYPYKFGGGVKGSPNYYPRRPIGNYPMGLYNIVVDKWVGGVHTQWKDSLYTHYGDSAQYIVHW